MVTKESILTDRGKIVHAYTNISEYESMIRKTCPRWFSKERLTRDDEGFRVSSRLWYYISEIGISLANTPRVHCPSAVVVVIVVAGKMHLGSVVSPLALSLSVRRAVFYGDLPCSSANAFRIVHPAVVYLREVLFSLRLFAIVPAFSAAAVGSWWKCNSWCSRTKRVK